MSDPRFFISKEDLNNLIQHFENFRTVEIEEKQLKGFILQAGVDEGGQARIFSNPLYSDQEIGNEHHDTIIENKDLGKACPYPPGYPV